MLRNNKIIKAIYKTMAKLTSKDTEKNSEAPAQDKNTTELRKELTPGEQKNEILKFLNEKNFGMWMSESEIEKAMADKIHYYYVRQLLPYLRMEKYINHTTAQESYQISVEGKIFLEKGGYKD